VAKSFLAFVKIQLTHTVKFCNKLDGSIHCSTTLILLIIKGTTQQAVTIHQIFLSRTGGIEKTTV
jgi:hypothetical protein